MTKLNKFWNEHIMIVLGRMLAVLSCVALSAAEPLLGADPKTWAPAQKLGENPATWAPIPTEEKNATRRQMASEGCNACCFQNDCRLAFSQTQPGTCCGAHRARGQVGCCPMGASCVACANIWKCTRSTYVTRSSRCSICSDDMPQECRYRSYHSYHGGSTMGPGLLLMIGLCAIAACMFYGRSEPDVVMVQQPVMGQQVMGPNGQVMMVQQQPGCYGGGYGCACLPAYAKSLAPASPCLCHRRLVLPCASTSSPLSSSSPLTPPPPARSPCLHRRRRRAGGGRGGDRIRRRHARW